MQGQALRARALLAPFFFATGIRALMPVAGLSEAYPLALGQACQGDRQEGPPGGRNGRRRVLVELGRRRQSDGRPGRIVRGLQIDLPCERRRLRSAQFLCHLLCIRWLCAKAFGFPRGATCTISSDSAPLSTVCHLTISRQLERGDTRESPRARGYPRAKPHERVATQDESGDRRERQQEERGNRSERPCGMEAWSVRALWKCGA